jgi:hypothetical protein
MEAERARLQAELLDKQKAEGANVKALKAEFEA